MYILTYLVIFSMIFLISGSAYASTPIGDVPKTMRQQINLNYSDDLEIICDRDKIQLKKISNQKTVCIFPDSVPKLFERNYLTSIEDHKPFVYIYNNDLKIGEEITIFGQIKNLDRITISMSDSKNNQLGNIDIIELDYQGKFVFKKVMVDEFETLGIHYFDIVGRSFEMKIPFQITFK